MKITITGATISEAAKAKIPNLQSRIFIGATGSGKSTKINNFIKNNNLNKIATEEGVTGGGTPCEVVYYTKN